MYRTDIGYLFPHLCVFHFEAWNQQNLSSNIAYSNVVNDYLMIIGVQSNCCFWSFNAFCNRTFCIYDHLIKRVLHIWWHRDKSSYVYYQFVQRLQIRWCFCCLLVTRRVSLVEYIGDVMVSVIASNAVDWESAHNQDNVS